MRMPRGESAIIDLTKLRDYCLSRVHPHGRHKARVFTSALGITRMDAEFLRGALRRAARDGDATKGQTDEFGERYIIDFELVRNDRRATVRSAWIIRRSDSAPRLTSCYVLLD